MLKKIISAILVIVSCLSIGMSLTGCENETDNTNDYAPGNPQYDYDSWKAQQWLNNNYK